jgi:hypothetical protein
MIVEAPHASFRQVLSISEILFHDWTEEAKKHAVDLSCIGILVFKRMTVMVRMWGSLFIIAEKPVENLGIQPAGAMPPSDRHRQIISLANDVRVRA